LDAGAARSVSADSREKAESFGWEKGLEEVDGSKGLASSGWGSNGFAEATRVRRVTQGSGSREMGDGREGKRTRRGRGVGEGEETDGTC
jgi:hypothetical protein